MGSEIPAHAIICFHTDHADCRLAQVRDITMSMLASTSTACYSCVLAQAASRTIKASTSTTIRFLSDVPGPDSGARKRKWKDVVWPHPSTLQTKSLIGELERLRNEDGVKIHESVFATGRKMLRDGLVWLYCVILCTFAHTESLFQFAQPTTLVRGT